MIPLSILDQSPIRAGGTAASALKETLDLAQHAERWGYKRYWVAEHHSSGTFAGSAPEIMIGAIAARTHTIRVGSGGVMLPHYSPLKVAEQFRVLESLYPDRIDLGLGRAPGSDARTARALQPGPQAYDISVFPQQLELLIQFLEDANGKQEDQGGFPKAHPFYGIHASPLGPEFPELWMLGSGGDGAIHAATCGMPYCFAHFINQDAGSSPVDLYRQHFRPSVRLERPYVSVGVSVTVAETQEEAECVAASRDLWIVQFLQNKAGPFRPPEEALAYPYSRQEKKLLETVKTRSITGTPQQVRARLLQLVETFGADELVILTITFEHAARLRSYELLAQAFLLDPPHMPT